MHIVLILIERFNTIVSISFDFISIEINWRKIGGKKIKSKFGDLLLNYRVTKSAFHERNSELDLFCWLNEFFKTNGTKKSGGLKPFIQKLIADKKYRISNKILTNILISITFSWHLSGIRMAAFDVNHMVRFEHHCEECRSDFIFWLKYNKKLITLGCEIKATN